MDSLDKYINVISGCQESKKIFFRDVKLSVNNINSVSGVYSRNTGYEAGIHPVYRRAPCTHSITLRVI